MEESKIGIWLIGALSPIVIMGDLEKTKDFSKYLAFGKVLEAYTEDGEKIIIPVSNIAYLKALKEA